MQNFILCLYVINVSFHIKCLLRHIIVLANQNFTKTSDSFFAFYIGPLHAGKLFGDKEWLAQKLLNFSRTLNGEFVDIGQFFHAENGNNILQIFISLQYLLDLARLPIMLLPNNQWIKNSGA